MKGFEKHSEDEYQLPLIDIEIIREDGLWYLYLNSKKFGSGHEEPRFAFEAATPIIKRRVAAINKMMSA